MTKKDARLRIYIFYLLTLVPTILWCIFSAAGLAGSLDTDTGEKRNKHQVAEDTTAANLTEELELTYNDYAPFRSVLLRTNSALDYAVETPYLNGILPGLTALANAALGVETTDTADEAGPGGMPSKNTAPIGAENNAAGIPDDGMAETSGTPAEELAPYYETPEESGYYPYVELAPEVIKGRDGWLFRNEVVPDYTGGTLQSEASLAETAGNMQMLKNLCDEKGIELHFLALPNKSTVYPEYMPSLDAADYTALEQLEDYINSGYDVSFTFLKDELLAAKKYGRLYFMTDTHWNGLGAMTGAAALHRIMGLEAIDQGSLPVVAGDAITGDLVYYTGLPTDSFPDDYNMDYTYQPEISIEQIQGGDDILDEFTSTAPDGRTLVYVGDSYRHHLLQYLNRDFAHSYFINEKYLGAEHAAILKSADILIVENVERNFYVNPDALLAVPELIDLMSS